MTKKIYKKSVLLSAVVLISFFSLAYSSTVELQPIADGYFDLLKSCYRCPVPPSYCCCSSSGYIRSGILLNNSTYGDCFYFGEYSYIKAGIIEFDISSVNGVFQNTQINATLTLTIKSVSNVLANNYIYLSDIKDENENGIVEYNDTNVQGTIGTATFGNQVQPGDKITFDVTQALAHDMFDPNQSTFSGFVLNTTLYYDSGAPSYTFYDHTSHGNAPRLTITGTTLITLSSFTATPKFSKVIIQWATESEIDNAGFNLCRSTSEDGEYIKINDSLISAQGSSSQGASYEFIDKNVKNRKTYYYKLEDIDLNGTATMYEPVSATPRWWYGMKRGKK